MVPPLTPAQILARAQRNCQDPGPIGDPVLPCKDVIRVFVNFDDYWKTPVVHRPFRLVDNEGPLHDGDKKTSCVLAQGCTDGDAGVLPVRGKLGIIEHYKVETGGVDIELIDEGSEAEVKAAENALKTALDSFRDDMAEVMKPWLDPYRENKIGAVWDAASSGLGKGISDWWEGEKQFWSDAWDWVSGGEEAQATAPAPQQTQPIGRVSSARPAGQQGVVPVGGGFNALDAMSEDAFRTAGSTPAVARGLSSTTSLTQPVTLPTYAAGTNLWARIDDLLNFIKYLFEGSIDRIEGAYDHLVSVFSGTDLGGLLQDIKDNGTEWIQALIAVINETAQAIPDIGATLGAVISMLVPNFWIDMFAQGIGNLLPEVVISAILMFIGALAAVAAGTGAILIAARIAKFTRTVMNAMESLAKFGKVFGTLWRGLRKVADKLTELCNAAWKRIRGKDRQMSGGDRRMEVPVKRPLPKSLLDHIKKRDRSVPRKRGIGGAHDKNEFMQALAEEGGEVTSRTPHPTLKGVEKVEYRMAKLDKFGKPTGELQQKVFTKTIYDPASVSDAKMMRWGQQAAENAMSNANGTLPREWIGTAADGTSIRGYADSITGEITSFFLDF